jgi:hypothetical protein
MVLYKVSFFHSSQIFNMAARANRSTQYNEKLVNKYPQNTEYRHKFYLDLNLDVCVNLKIKKYKEKICSELSNINWNQT